MKFAWTVAGDDPDYAHGDKHEINGYFWPMFDSLTTTPNLKDTTARGYAVGVYMATTHDPQSVWYPKFGSDKTPQQIAANVNAEYKRLAVPKLRVQFDMEEHDPDRIADTLEAWRVVQPNVNTSWTMEAGQAGWMNDPPFRDRVLACKVRIVPQCYNGAMTQVWDTWAYCNELLKGGWPASSISPFYDAKHLPVGWDGYVFTLGRLP